MGGPVASLLDTQLTASSFASLPAPPPPHCRSQHRPTAAPTPTLAAHASPPLPAQCEPVAHPRSSWQADTGVWSGGRMAALSGAQPAQRSAGPKRAAWQRALFRFPIPNRRLRGYCVTPYYRLHRSACQRKLVVASCDAGAGLFCARCSGFTKDTFAPSAAVWSIPHRGYCIHS